MAENLGQIDVVIKDDSRGLRVPGQAPGGQGGAEPGGPGLPFVAPGGATAGRAAGGMGALGAVGLAAGLGIAAFTAGIVTAIKKLQSWSNELANTTKKLSFLNTQAALAGVIEEFGEFRRNLRMGRVLGPTMLSVARLKDRIQDNLQPLKETFALLKAKAVENFMALIVVVTKRLGDLAIGLQLVVDFITQTFNEFMMFVSQLGTALFMYGQSLGLAGDLSGITGFGALLIKIVELLDQLRGEIKDTKEDARSRDEYEEAKLANSELMSQLQQLTGGFWRHDTQVIGALGTGQTLNPEGFKRQQEEENRGF